MFAELTAPTIFLMYLALDTSDPLISYFRSNTRIYQRKRLTLQSQVIAILSCDDLPLTSKYEQNTDSEENTYVEPEEDN